MVRGGRAMVRGGRVCRVSVGLSCYNIQYPHTCISQVLSIYRVASLYDDSTTMFIFSFICLSLPLTLVQVRRVLWILQASASSLATSWPGSRGQPSGKTPATRRPGVTCWPRSKLLVTQYTKTGTPGVMHATVCLHCRLGSWLVFKMPSPASCARSSFTSRSPLHVDITFAK